jgi:uroporphyrin-III C-methyltransferase
MLTLSAIEAIKNADLILSDKLTSETGKGILELAHCEVRIAQKYKVAGSAKRAQDELNAQGLEALRQGKRVVRLKCGDPFVFGRGGEEVIFFRQHGFESTVIPGISSALYAPMAAGIPITHRGVATEFLVTTGMLKEGAVSRVPEYSPGRTTVLLMAVGRLPHMSNELKQAEYPPNCPVAIIERAGSPEQRVIKSSVASVSETGARFEIVSPSVIVIGEAVSALHAK